MHAYALLTGALLGLTMSAVPTSAVTISFADHAVGLVQGSLVYPDATFASSTGQLYVGAAGGDHALCPLSGAHCAATLNVSFTAPISNLSFLVDGDNSTTSSVFVTGTGSAGAFTFTAGGFDGIVQTFTTVDLSGIPGISSISIATNDPAGLGYDTFRFDLPTDDGTGSTVPEPMSWVMLLGGFALAGWQLRRNRRTGANYVGRIPNRN